MKHILVLLVILSVTVSRAQEIDQVNRGKLDLSNWDTSTSPVLSLDGEWMFDWNRLVGAKDFKKRKSQTYARLSRPWNEQRIDGILLPGNGCASYYLQLILPSNMDSVSFEIPAVFNSYAFWVNDELICKSGTVATSKAEMEPKWMPQTVVVSTNRDTLDVVFQIASYQNTRGGCAEVMRIGDAQYLPAKNKIIRSSGYMMIVLFGIAGMGGVIVFAIMGIRSFLYLGVLSFSFMIRFMFSDLYLYDEFGIRFAWAVVAKIEYLTVPLIVFCASFLMATIYPQEFRKKSLYFFATLNALLILVVIIASSSWFSPLLLVLQIVVLVFIFYVIYALVKAILYHRGGAWVSAFGLAVFAAVGFYNVYAFVAMSDLNRVIIYAGYLIALVLNVISLFYRTPVRLLSEERDILRYSDLYQS